jgi:hypothetical protein
MRCRPAQPVQLSSRIPEQRDGQAEELLTGRQDQVGFKFIELIL